MPASNTDGKPPTAKQTQRTSTTNRQARAGVAEGQVAEQDRTKEELHRTRARLQQIEYEFRHARGEIANLHRTCVELDSGNKRQEDTILGLQRELAQVMEKYQATPTDNEPESLSAARAILDGAGAYPVMAVVDAILVLHKEIVKVSNFLAENIRHISYELFEEELDRCYQESQKIIGERLSKFLREHSEAEDLSQSLIKMSIQMLITSFCASEWSHFVDPTLKIADKNTAKDRKERKAAFLRTLISVFKIAAWVIPGSAKRAAFEESLNPLFSSMDKIEGAWTKVPESTKVSLSFLSPGKDLADVQVYTEDATISAIHDIVLGTSAFGVHCLFQDHAKGVEDKPKSLLAGKVFLERNLQSIFNQEDQKPSCVSHQRNSKLGDGRDP